MYIQKDNGVIMSGVRDHQDYPCGGQVGFCRGICIQSVRVYSAAGAGIYTDKKRLCIYQIWK